MDTNLEQSYYSAQYVKNVTKECMERHGLNCNDVAELKEVAKLKEATSKFIGFMQTFADKQAETLGQPDNTYLVTILNDVEIRDTYISTYGQIEPTIEEALEYMRELKIEDKYRIEIIIE